MIATLLIIGILFYWLMIETNWLRVRLLIGSDVSPAIKLLTASKPVLMLTSGNPDTYPMTLTTTVRELKALIDQLSKTELELTEEVLGYDYSDQA